MAPNQYGSSTIGVKKSAVRTMAVSLEIRYTPASSAFDRPTRTFGSVIAGNCPRTWDSSAGLNFAAQPAQLERCVSLISIEINYDIFFRKSQCLVSQALTVRDRQKQLQSLLPEAINQQIGILLEISSFRHLQVRIV